MHCIDILDIVCLYSFKSIMMVTVVVHSLPFHSHFLVISIWFSNGVENFNKTIHLRRFSIFDHTGFSHVLNFSIAWIWTTSILWIICPIKVSSDIIVLDRCIIVWIVNSIKINETIMYLLMLLFGHGTNDTNGLVWVDSDTDVFVSRLTLDSDRQLEYWYTNIYCIVDSTYIVWRCVFDVDN